MDYSKFFLLSRGIVGGLIPIVFGVLGLLGYAIEPGMEDEAAKLATSLIDTLVLVTENVLLVAAGALALWSRLRKEKLELRLSPMPRD